MFGQNTACYKFSLAQALLEKAETGVSEVPLNALAEVYADNICQHLIKSPIQGTNPTNSHLQTYRDYNLWTKMAITGLAKSGKFSSDRTIAQYCNEIWNI